MITLERIRLVNWHYFRDETIPVGNFCLLSGDNASGKSTIIDAIQFVIASDLRKVRFNAAASSRGGGRDLAGYVRCKLGSDSTEYLRGDAVGHVMLEFSDGDGGFSAGACVEAWKDGRLNSRFWIATGLEVHRLVTVSESGGPLLGRQFQDALAPAGASFYDSSAGFRRDLTAKLGVWRRMSESNPYIEAFLRSLHFTPLVSVDQFVCDYILDEQTIDLSVMKQNLESYQQAEDLARATRDRIEALGRLLEAGEECRSRERVVLQQDWMKRRLECSRYRTLLEKARADAERLRRRSAEIESELDALDGKKASLAGEYRDTERALARDDAHQLYRSLSERLEQLSRDEREANRLADRRELLLSQCTPLFDGLFPGVPLTLDDMPAAIDQIEQLREQKLADRQRKTDELTKVKDMLADARTELADLEQGIRRLPEGPTTLRKALKENGIEAWILCDLAEVTDPSWSDAVEGWLNTLRFACIVAPEHFQKALSIYDRQPRSVAGIPLPDIARMAAEPKSSNRAAEHPKAQNTLACLVETDNPWARTYLDAILGDVMTADLATLRRYSKSVTKECMSWSRFTATRIKEEVYRVSWLGAAARERRREILAADIENLSAEQGRLVAGIARNEEHLAACKSLSKSLAEADRLLPALEDLERIRRDRAEMQERLKEIDTSAFRGLQARLDELSALLAEADKKSASLHTEAGSVSASLAALAERTASLEENLAQAEIEFEEFRAAHSESERDCERYVADRLKSKTAEDILQNFVSTRQGFVSRLETAMSLFQNQVTHYTARFSELISPQLSSLPAIRAMRQRLEGSELPEYLEKIRKARMDA